MIIYVTVISVSVRCEVLTAMKMTVFFFWDVWTWRQYTIVSEKLIVSIFRAEVHIYVLVYTTSLSLW
jgi:hypothetical protein